MYVYAHMCMKYTYVYMYVCIMKVHRDTRNEEIQDNIIDDHVITVRDTEEEGGGEFEDDVLAIFDQKEFRLRAIRKFHFLMLIRVCCYFIMTSSKRGHLFGFRIPFIGQTWDGIFGMIGAGIAVWKNLPSVIKG